MTLTPDRALRAVGATITTSDGHKLSVLVDARGNVYVTLEWEPGEGQLVRLGHAPAAYVAGLLAQASGVTR